MGDAINIASRLESLNKTYGTRIIVSDAFYQIIKNKFVLRKVDRVAVKGKIASGDIYELLAEDKRELSYDIDAYRAAFEAGFLAYEKSDWEKAIASFEHCLKVNPFDSVALVFIRRCERFKLNPPRPWDGVWRMNLK